jgi:hypothetical protein
MSRHPQSEIDAPDMYDQPGGMAMTADDGGLGFVGVNGGILYTWGRGKLVALHGHRAQQAASYSLPVSLVEWPCLCGNNIHHFHSHKCRHLLNYSHDQWV